MNMCTKGGPVGLAGSFVGDGCLIKVTEFHTGRNNQLEVLGSFSVRKSSLSGIMLVRMIYPC
jgi:hypothetical protein